SAHSQRTWRSPEFGEWAIRADRHARAGTVERIYADIAQGMRILYIEGPPARHMLLRKAMERARALGDSGAFFAAAAWAVSNLQALKDRELVDGLAREVMARPHEGVRPGDLAQCLDFAGSRLLGRGERAA